ncbi:alpha/beta fold hydrolase [Lyngbya confervoides]|uniref:Alpha/beta hydrolase n=1 Tax=Lyngbya confervoides BDU141951 TaxID=1574623 RepID=A0ABD4T131_9CYAN|nr:alpha/beta hydrolase [Lyngbya confervoides]MCM1982121.1 alpha/beta hydrolase [Lyngbya confervoides BDU141951]
MELKRHTLSRVDGPLSYLDGGAGKPVVMLHGLADHGLVWADLAQTLMPRYRCFAPDLRGHGLSLKPEIPSAYLASEFVKDLDALAEIHQWSDLQVIAHSWAAKVALLWAKTRPTLIQQLILVDPFFVNQLPKILRPTLPLIYGTLPFLKVLGPFPSALAAEQVARSLKQYRGWSPLQQEVFRANLEQKADGRWGSRFVLAARNGIFADCFQTSGLTEPLDVATEIFLPAAGLNRLSWQIQPYRDYLSCLSIRRISGNHWPHLVTPKAFNLVVQQSLNPG